MGCLTYSVAPIYDSEFSANPCNDFAFNATCVSDFFLTATRICDFVFGSETLHDMEFRCELVCTVHPYLKIKPDMIWLTDWSAENDVLSNINWIVD